MSHVSTYAQKITDITLFCQICRSRGYEVIEEGKEVSLFGANKVSAVASVKITGWRYPVAITAEGELRYDHFGSEPGTMELLGETCQDYNQSLVSRNIPYDVVQNYYTDILANGDRKLVLEYE